MVFREDIIEPPYNTVVTVSGPRQPYTSGVQSTLTVLDQSWSKDPTSTTTDSAQTRPPQQEMEVDSEQDQEGPVRQVAADRTANSGSGTGAHATTTGEIELQEAVKKLWSSLIDAEVEMRVAKRTISTRDREIQLLKAQIVAGGSDPTVASSLAAAEAERDATQAEVAALTAKLTNASGVVDGTLMVSLTMDMNQWSADLGAPRQAVASPRPLEIRETT